MTIFAGPHGMMTAGVSSLTFVNSLATFEASSNSFGLPSGAAAGDLALMSGRLVGDTSTRASGWTLVEDFSNSANGAQWLMYRVLQSGDSTWTHAGGFSSYLTLMAVFRPDVPISNVVITDSDMVDPTDGDPGDIVMNSPGVPSAVWAYYQSASPPISPGMDPVSDGTVNFGGATNIIMAWKVFNTADQDVTISLGDHGTLNTIMGGAIQVF